MKAPAKPDGGSRAVAAGVLAAALLCSGLAAAKDATPVAADPVIEARMHAITQELRCLVCQNQTVADSNSELADDLRRQVREMLRRGDSDAQIRTYMTDRYGDFVLYRPPVQATTLLLWAGPGVLLVASLFILGLVLRRRARLSDDRFEPDEGLDPDDEATGVPPSPSGSGETPSVPTRPKEGPRKATHKRKRR